MSRPTPGRRGPSRGTDESLEVSSDSLLRHGMPLEAQLQVALHVTPFREQDAVHHAVPHRPVAAGGMMPDDAVLLRAQALDGALRPEVEVVRAQADDLAAERLERVGQE